MGAESKEKMSLWKALGNNIYVMRLGNKLSRSRVIHAFITKVFFYFECAAAKAPAYDVCFLDIEMPGMDGMELARRMRKGKGREIIVFLTAYSEFIRAGYEVKAFDYLLKDRAAQERKALKDVLDRLGSGEFILVERGYVINLNHIKRVCSRNVELSDGINIPVSRAHISELKKRNRNFGIQSWSPSHGCSRIM